MALDRLVSDNLVSVLVFAATVLVVALLFANRRLRRRYNIPNGPPALPFFGNVLSLKSDEEFLNQLIDFGKQYGPVYSLNLGRKLVVVVNGWERIKEVAVDTGLDYADRSVSPTFKRINRNMLGRTMFIINVWSVCVCRRLSLLLISVLVY